MDLRAILMGVAFALIWSSAFTSGHIIVAHAPALGALALRFLIAGTVAVSIARAMGQSWHLTKHQAHATILFGICQNALYLGLFFVAMQTIEASLAAIIASSMPLIVALVGLLFLGERTSRLGIAGLMLGFVGVAVIMGSRLEEGGVDIRGVVFCVVGVIALAIATLSVRDASSGGNILMIVGLQMLVGGLALVPISLLTETWQVNWSWEFVAALAYSTFIAGLVATMIWFLLVRRIGAIKAATFHFLNPFFGVVIAAVLLGETIEWWDFVGVAIIMAGILAVQLARHPDTNPTGK